MIIPTVIPTSFAPTDPLLHRLQSLRRGSIGPIYEWDPDASVYLAAGEALDGQPLEIAVAKAMNEHLFIAAKQPGTSPIAATRWEAMLAGTALNMSGWRSLAAALLPLHASMPTPTNVNFVQGDYDRVTGLKGGNNKRIHSGLLNDANPLNDNSAYMRVTEGCNRFTASTTLFRAGIISNINTRGITHGGNAEIMAIYNNASGQITPDLASESSHYDTPGGFGVSRASSVLTKRMTRSSMASDSTTESTTTDAYELTFFSNHDDTGRYTNARASFACGGRAIDLAAMDTILASYMAALAAALS